MKRDLNSFSFSVSMCVYGGDNPEWFKTAVESILNQSLKPKEVVLVVDGPVPHNLNRIIQTYEDNPIFTVIKLTNNQGHGNARRIGLENCKYEYIALMDADDISVANRFELQSEAFVNNKELDIVGGNMSEFIEEPTNIVGYRIVPQDDEDIKEYMKTRCPMNQVTVMFRADSVKKAGGYLDWFCEEDYYLWLRMFLAGMTFYNCKEVLVNVRTGKEQYQRRGGWRYFSSEVKLQKYMLNERIINYRTYLSNIFKRLVVQVLLPSCIRGWVFKNFARKSV